MIANKAELIIRVLDLAQDRFIDEDDPLVQDLARVVLSKYSEYKRTKGSFYKASLLARTEVVQEILSGHY